MIPRPQAKPLRLIAYDTGPTRTAYAIVQENNGTRFFCGGGIVDSTTEALRKTLDQEWDALAAEKVGLAFRVEARHNLIDTAHVVGIITGIVSEMRPKRSVQLITAVNWRLALTGKRNASDAEIKQVVLARVNDMGKKSNAHIRDAVGLALVALWRIRVGEVKIP